MKDTRRDGVISIVWYIPILALLVLVIMDVGACGSTQDKPEGVEGVNNVAVRLVPWHMASVIGHRSVKIRSVIGYCKGNPKPRYKRIHVEEHKGGIYITASVAVPRRNPDVKLCFGIALLLSRTVHVERDLETVKLYDGSTEPPRLRWTPQGKERVPAAT